MLSRGSRGRNNLSTLAAMPSVKVSGINSEGNKSDWGLGRAPGGVSGPAAGMTCNVKLLRLIQCFSMLWTCIATMASSLAKD